MRSSAMTRKDTLLAHIDKHGLGLEIGPAFNAVAPKREGYNVEILDCVTQDQLIFTFGDEYAERIEEVDYVWHGEPYADLIGPHRYDWIIASHVIEHTPDLIGFLNNCESVLKPTGILSLAIPNKYFCFDCFRPVSGIGKIIDAHLRGDTEHTPGSAAEFFLHVVSKAGVIAWAEGTQGECALLYPDAVPYIDQFVAQQGYHDCHAWVFTPDSFRLLVRDLSDLGYISLHEKQYSPTVGCEFFVVLSPGRADRIPPAERLVMMRAAYAA